MKKYVEVWKTILDTGTGFNRAQAGRLLPKLDETTLRESTRRCWIGRVRSHRSSR